MVPVSVEMVYPTARQEKWRIHKLSYLSLMTLLKHKSLYFFGFKKALKVTLKVRKTPNSSISLDTYTSYLQENIPNAANW